MEKQAQNSGTMETMLEILRKPMLATNGVESMTDDEYYSSQLQRDRKKTAEELRSRRLANELTQEAIAKGIGSSTTTICNFEKGRYLTQWDMIANAYRMFLESKRQPADTHEPKLLPLPNSTLIENGRISEILIKGLEAEFFRTHSIDFLDEELKFKVVRGYTYDNEGEICLYVAALQYIDTACEVCDNQDICPGEGKCIGENDVYIIDNELGDTEIYSGITNVEAMKVIKELENELSATAYKAFQELLNDEQPQEQPQSITETITDQTMIGNVIEGIGQDIKDSQSFSRLKNGFIQSHPFKDNSLIVLYQANYNGSEEYNEELPDISKYIYDVYVFDGDTLKIHRNHTEAQARAIFAEHGAKFWLDK